MSLLLDALKKAAEQKAQKSKQEQQPESPSSDATEVYETSEKASELEARGDDRLQQSRQGRDETQLDESEFDTQVDQTEVRLDPDDETGIEYAEETRTWVVDPSQQMQTGEDETIVFSDEDVSDFLDEPTRVERRPDDETELTRSLDETEHDTEHTQADESVFLQGALPEDDETDISVPTGRADEIDAGVVGEGPVGDVTAVDETEVDVTGHLPDEDLSLLLVDRDPTGMTGMTGTSVTDPQSPGAPVDALEDGDELALVDTTRHSPPPDDGTVTERSSTSTTRSADTLTGEGTTQRAEVTATTTGATTRTYAPDNYDRTLMKLPNQDASQLFAGMKSDSDVVMTPDYAKKVFQSKSSAQRLQHYKLYIGIAFAILLGIGVYGLFEMQYESARIESSLQPLKRDPMPGIIRPEANQPAGITLPAVGVDEKTIELIESAADLPAAEAGGEVAAEQGVIATEAETATADAAAAASDTLTTAATRSTPAPGTVITGEIGTEARAAAPSAGGTLELRSSSRVSERDRLLREAYDAYVAGDDARALVNYNKVLDIDPRNRNALLARAAIHVQNGDTTAAIGDYQSLLLINPKDSLAMSSLLTIANYSPQETESQIKLLLRDEPESPHLNFALANAYGSQNRWQEAQKHYFTALQNNPEDPNYAYNLAVSLEHIAKPEVAIAYYQRALDNFDKGLATFSRDVVDQRLATLRKL